MATIYTINKPNKKKLMSVIAEMRVLGTAKIRAFWTGDSYLAIEGSHRVAAAAAIGVPIEIIDVCESDEICDHDIGDLKSSCTVGEILEYANWNVAAYNVETA